MQKNNSSKHKNYNKESSLIDLEVNVYNANPKPGSIRGTPGYTAPEILNGIHCGDISSDIYSLGVLLYELLSYRKPVRGSNAEELFENTRNNNIVPLEVKAKWQRTPVALTKDLQPKNSLKYLKKPFT